MPIKANAGKTIKTILFESCLFIFLPAAAFCYTEIPAGTICTSSWGPGTVLVTGNVTVSDSCQLTILPKTIVKFAPLTQLTVYGTLMAVGSAVDDIVFTSRNDNAFGETVDGSDGMPSPGDWQGIFLSGNSADHGIGYFDYCRVRYGGDTAGIVDANIRFYYSDSGAFTNSISEFSEFRGLWIDSASPLISNATISNNSQFAIYCNQSASRIINTIIWGNTDSIFTAGSVSPVVQYSNIQGGYPGDTNIDLDPLFIDINGGDFHLFHCSPAVDAGDPVERLRSGYTSGERTLALEAVTNVVTDDIVWITDGTTLESDTVTDVTPGSISISNGFSNSYPAADNHRMEFL